jgi:hypothetical protein
MKLFTNLFILTSLLAIACGPTKNDPLQKYKHLNLTKDTPSTTQKVEFKYQPQYIKGDTITKYVGVPVTTTVSNQVLVYVNNCPPEIINEGETPADCAKRLTEYVPQISLDGPVFEVKAYSDEQMLQEASVIFKEGQETTYYVVGKVLYKSIVNFELTFDNLPVGSKVEEIETTDDDNIAKYKITWKPGLELIKGDKISEQSSLATTLTNIEYKDSAQNNYLMETTFSYVSKSTEVPMLLLSSEISDLTAEESTTAEAQTSTTETTVPKTTSSDSGGRR